MAITALNRIARYFGYVPESRASQPETWDALYGVNDSLYDGYAYSTSINGGYLDSILTTYIGSGYTDVNTHKIFPFFMPFKEIVETYQNVFPGTWGKELKPVAVSENVKLNDRLPPVLETIWRDSGLDTNKQKLIRWAANFGTVGLRISYRKSVGGNPGRPVITVDHPRRLNNFEEDSEGNVVAVSLKYQKEINAGTLSDPKFESVEVVEEITKEDFSRTVDGEEQIPDAERKNNVGFCPYVILRHKDNGTQRGDWAYKGSESVVHRINWRVSRQDKSVDRHQFPKWFGAGAGDKPATVDMGDTKMSWVKLHPDSPPPLLQAIVANVDQKAAQDFWMSLRNELRGRQPELNLNDVTLIAGTSGETMAQVLKPTEQAIESVKPNYDHALIRSMQMATSMGVVNGSIDLLTGFGPDSADKAYRDGLEDFALAERDALPLTPQQRMAITQAKKAEREEREAAETPPAQRQQPTTPGAPNATANRRPNSQRLEAAMAAIAPLP